MLANAPKLAALLICTVILALFAVFVWPTRYKYEHASFSIPSARRFDCKLSAALVKRLLGGSMSKATRLLAHPGEDYKSACIRRRRLLTIARRVLCPDGRNT
jgi:hypothetical protein